MALTLAFGPLFVLASGGNKKARNPVSRITQKGYWVVEKTGKKDQLVIVWYYNNANDLLKKEIRPKRKDNIGRPKVRRSLNRSLEEALAWAEPI